MEIYCEHCRNGFEVSIKKSHRQLSDKVHKIVICPNCGKKNFPTINDIRGEENYHEFKFR